MFTDEQQAAIFNHTHNLLVTAGAGSGKTRVLVEHYLAILDQHTDWQLTDLVAITFSKKATREMRDRLRHTVHERVNASEEAIRERWRDLEAQLDQARIDTIHGLCSELLRSNPAQAELDPAFEVLEENEAHLVLRDAIEVALEAVANSPAADLFQFYSEYEIRNVLTHYAPRSIGQAVLAQLPQDAKTLLDDWAARYESAVEAWVKAIHQDTLLWSSLAWQAPHGWPNLEDKRMQVWAAVHEHSPHLESTDPQLLYETLQSLGAQIKLTGGTEKNWGSKAALAESKAHLAAIRQQAESHLAATPISLGETDATIAHLLILWREAVHLGMNEYQAAKQRRAALDFDDLETLAVDLLNAHPDVAERYAGKLFKHLMVDEFQDTNARQRDLIYRLCGVDQQVGTAPAGRLFVVGDPKQSIYAFRGADVSVFQAVSAELVGWGGQQLYLSRSFRTHEGLVGAFNQLFQFLLTGGNGYEVGFDRPMTAHRPTPAELQSPQIEITLLEKPKDWDSKGLRRWEAYEIAQRIHTWVREGRLVYDKAAQAYRPIEYGDVAILLRSLTHTPTYEDVFKQLGLPYITLGGRGYYNRQEVWDVLNLLTVLYNPLDDLALASVLRSPIIGLSDDGLLALRLVKGEDGKPIKLWNVLHEGDPATFPFELPTVDHAPFLFAREVLADLRQSAGRVTVEALLEEALEATAYDAILMALPDGERRRANIEKLLELARKSGRISLQEFLLYINELSEAESREGEAILESHQAVQIMSVHKSKGLEFPLVILAQADWTPRDYDKLPLIYDPISGVACRIRDEDNKPIATFAWQQIKTEAERRELAEHKRLLYVAATRAQDYLWIMGKAADNPPPDTWLGMVLAARENDPTLESLFPVSMPPAPDLDNLLGYNTSVPRGWDVLDSASDLMQMPPMMPPLTEPLPFIPQSGLRHFSVSQLEQLGYYGQHTTDQIKRAFRQSVLHDSPAAIRPLQPLPQDAHRMIRRGIGQIVHRALQVQALPSRYTSPALRQILEAYAWDEGISNPSAIEQVVNEAQSLLLRYESAELPFSFTHAERTLREVPFIYQLGERVIHGIMDVVYYHQGTWYILDYKTADIRANSVPEHAKRYAIQLGAYAMALQERLNSPQAPTVQLYYLHPAQWYELPIAQWQAAMSQFDHWVAKALEE